MKAQELRINNYINAVLTNETYTVDIWALRTIEEGNFQNSYNTDVKVFEPIPLTEEWLLKFGFITTQWDNFNSYRLVIGDNDYAIVIYSNGKCEVGDIIITKINYVHQLQNLYFALTGEELTFKSE